MVVEPPIGKICSSNWIISPSRGENKKYLKPPLSFNLNMFQRLFFVCAVEFLSRKQTPTLPENNSSPLKMDGWKAILSFWGPAYFQRLWLLVSGRLHSFGSSHHSWRQQFHPSFQTNAEIPRVATPFWYRKLDHRPLDFFFLGGGGGLRGGRTNWMFPVQTMADGLYVYNNMYL